jgi:hypothetical protein
MCNKFEQILDGILDVYDAYLVWLTYITIEIEQEYPYVSPHLRKFFWNSLNSN